MARTDGNDCDAMVVGTGPTGLAAALALARAGASVALLGPAPAAAPARTAALFPASLRLLDALGAGAACRAHGAPLAAIRLIDDTGGLLRAPEVVFEAADVGLEAFGWNVPNQVLIDALAAAAAAHPGIVRLPTRAVDRVEITDRLVRATTREGKAIAALLLVGADGRHGRSRTAAGIPLREWSYPQSAVVALLRHGRPHRGVSTELHRRSGPLTVVPLPGRASSLVWVEQTAEAERLMQLGEGAFRGELETRLQGLLGAIEGATDRAAFALAGATAARMAGNRVALVGEAGHAFPPIGAQGLNLGLRDVATLADVAGAAVAAGRDPGAPDVMAAYADARAGDVATRTLAVDLLDRSLLVDLVPVDLLRGAGLHLVRALPWLRRALVAEGLQPAGALPTLMRPRDA